MWKIMSPCSFNQWVPACSKKKNYSYTCTLNWKCLGLFVTTQINLEPADAKTLYYKMLTLEYSPFILIQSIRKKQLFCIFKQQLQKSHEQDYNNSTKKKKIFKSIDCCLRPAGCISWIIFIFNLGIIFMYQRHRMQK